jgi:hypothetical protein
MRLRAYVCAVLLTLVGMLTLSAGPAAAEPSPCPTSNTSAPTQTCKDKEGKSIWDRTKGAAGTVGGAIKGVAMALPGPNCAKAVVDKIQGESIKGSVFKCVVPGAALGTAVGGAAVDAATSKVGSAVLDGLADAFGKTASEMMLASSNEWINADPVTPGETQSSKFIRDALLPIAALVAVAGLIWQGIVMMISRRSEPMVDVIRGFITLAIWSVVGITAPTFAMDAANGMATYFYTQAVLAHNSDPLGSVDAALKNKDVVDSMLRLTLALPLVVATFAQKIILIFREASVVILAGTTVLAAAGAFTAGTRHWIGRIVGWMLALIAYKPAAALVYLAATYMYDTADTMRQLYIGVMMMFMAIFALPVLMKMFTWATGQVSGNGLSGASSVAGQYALYGRGSGWRK